MGNKITPYICVCYLLGLAQAGGHGHGHGKEVCACAAKEADHPFSLDCKDKAAQAA
eukprot:SAG25_NODE_9086_length_388_cov_4.553633_1_plen_55_part_01